MTNKKHITESVAHYRDLIKNIDEGVGTLVFGKSAKEIAEKLGDRVVTTANGQKTVWKRVNKDGDNVVYEVIHSEGNTAIGTPIKPEDLSKLKPKPFDIRTDTLPAPKQPKVRKGPDGQGWEQQNANGEWVKWEKPITATPEPHLDPDNIKQGPAHDSQGRLEPKPGGHTPEEIWKAAAAKQQYVESMIKSGNGKFKEKAIQDQIDAGVPLLDAVDSLQPGKGVKQKIENDPKLRDKFFGSIESAWRKGKRVIIVAILIALGLWFLMRDKTPDDKKTGDPAQGTQQSDTSSGESSPAGTSIPADQVPWNYLQLKPEAFSGASITKKENMLGVEKWVAVMPDGSTKELPHDVATVKRIENVAKTPPNARMNLDKPFEVFLYGGGDTPDISTSTSTTPSTSWGAR